MARAKLTNEEKLERKRLYYIEWRKANPEKVRKATADWRLRNPDKSKAQSNRWKKENPFHHAAINSRRKAAILNRAVPWANSDEIKDIYRRASNLGHQVDHIVPLQGEFVSGLHVENNLQILEGSINASKKNKFDYWWL